MSELLFLVVIDQTINDIMHQIHRIISVGEVNIYPLQIIHFYFYFVCYQSKSNMRVLYFNLIEENQYDDYFL